VIVALSVFTVFAYGYMHVRWWCPIATYTSRIASHRRTIAFAFAAALIIDVILCVIIEPLAVNADWHITGYVITGFPVFRPNIINCVHEEIAICDFDRHLHIDDYFASMKFVFAIICTRRAFDRTVVTFAAFKSAGVSGILHRILTHEVTGVGTIADGCTTFTCTDEFANSIGVLACKNLARGDVKMVGDLNGYPPSARAVMLELDVVAVGNTAVVAECDPVGSSASGAFYIILCDAVFISGSKFPCS